jgi:curved DNA-binding protein CbpA
MSKEDYKKYFEIIELSTDASMTEVRNTYSRLKKLYSGDSIAIAPLADEISEKKRKKILKQIEEAYIIIMALLEKESKKSVQPKKSEALESEGEGKKEERTIFSGPSLKEIREKLGIPLHDISHQTKIRLEILKNIELEKFDALPPEIYLSGHLKNYASCILLNPKKVADDYIKHYREWEKKAKDKD